ncbi:hypothetical protein, partial [Rothia nasimurium]|uniref:hypothetical protein n=1 Tax=Rothia nasimurium TaxID=85336 RepID=UPI001F3A71B2
PQLSRKKRKTLNEHIDILLNGQAPGKENRQFTGRPLPPPPRRPLFLWAVKSPPRQVVPGRA